MGGNGLCMLGMADGSVLTAEMGADGGNGVTGVTGELLTGKECIGAIVCPEDFLSGTCPSIPYRVLHGHR